MWITPSIKSGNVNKKDPKIVVIGGGTGSFTLLSKLKNYTKNITAIVNMADDGGSTGILRDEMGVLPPGDVRQCLVALADDSSVLRELFSYRFGEGSLSGHSFGNLFLSVLEKTSGSFNEAVKQAASILKITGRVLPITNKDTHLVLVTAEGIEIRGEQAIAQTRWRASLRPDLRLDPAAPLNPEAAEAILAADLVVVAPGHLYGSLAPALLTKGLSKALQTSKAQKVYVCNLVTKPGQTDGFGVAEYAAEIERFIGKPVLDTVIYNIHTPSRDLLKKYAKHGEYGVKIEHEELSGMHYKAVGTDLISSKIFEQDPKDTLLARTLIRHDADKVAKQLLKLL